MMCPTVKIEILIYQILKKHFYYKTASVHCILLNQQLKGQWIGVDYS